MGGSGSFSRPDAVAAHIGDDLLRGGRQKVEWGAARLRGDVPEIASRCDVAGMTGLEPATFRVTVGAIFAGVRFSARRCGEPTMPACIRPSVARRTEDHLMRAACDWLTSAMAVKHDSSLEARPANAAAPAIPRAHPCWQAAPASLG